MRAMRSLQPGLVLLALLVGCDPEPTTPPSPDPLILYSYGLIGMSGGNWDLPAEASATVRAYSYGRNPTTLTLRSASLRNPSGLETPLALTVATPRLDFAGGDSAYVTLTNAGTLNRALASACGQAEVILVFHSSSCDCEVRVEGTEHVTCYADNGADPELEVTGEPAPAGRPCAARSYSTSEGVETLDGEQTFRYDAEGRLLFSDDFDDAGARLQRTFFSYESGTLLRERELISPTARAVTMRTRYVYGAGVLSTIERDGDGLVPPDGTPDATWTYGFDGDAWSESNGVNTTAYAYDPVALTVTRTDAVFHLTGPLAEPSRFFATGRLDMPKMTTSDHLKAGGTMTLTYSYAGDALLGVSSSELFGISFRDEFLYTCP
jgi:hypothetical protein